MRVLVVDDDQMVRATSRVMLEDAGIEVEEAASGNEALRAFRRRPADVILCDVFMPERDGMEIIRELRPRFSGVRIVAMSGWIPWQSGVAPAGPFSRSRRHLAQALQPARASRGHCAGPPDP